MTDAASVNSGPPSYTSSLSARSDAELPSYSPPLSRLHNTPVQPRPLVEHRYELTSGDRRAWATLTVRSRARSALHMPTFTEGDIIQGSIVLDIRKSEGFKSVNVLLKGRITTGSINGWNFVEVKSPLWERVASEKLQGHMEWPFSLAIPKEITVDSAGPQSSGPFRLPQTFLEKGVPASVQYDLIAEIKRPRFSSSSTSRLQTMVAYVPLTRPGSASALRRLAYQESSPLLGPEADPEGWLLLPSRSISGKLFSNRKVHIKCQLFLAAPLSYTRGTTIPCLMDITCSDCQAMDLLSAHSGVPLSLCLRRYVSAYDKLSGFSSSGGPNGVQQSVLMNSRRFYASEADWTDIVDDLSTGVWRPSIEGSSSPNETRRLSGEIPLSQSLKPTCRMGNFRIKYTVVLLPFAATGFSRSTASAAPLVEHEVDITTTFAPGPRPLSYLPSGHDTARSDGGNNYFMPPNASFLH